MLGLVIDILCYKYRWLAKSLLVYECIGMLPYVMTPNVYYL